MKKILLSLTALLILAVAAFIAYQNMPIKRHARHLVKARLFASEGNLSAAKLEYERAYDIIGGFSPLVSVEVLQLMNRLSLQEKNLPEALANSKAFVKRHAHNSEGWLILAELALQSRETSTAFDAIDTILSRDPANFPARLLLARIRTLQGRLDLAEEQLRVLHKYAPDSIATLLPLAENLLRQGHVAESRDFLRKAMAEKPKNGLVRLLLVDGYLLERKVDSVQLLFDEWKEADPTLALPIAVRKSNLYALQGRMDDARATLAPFLADKKEDNYAAFAEWAMLQVKQGRYDSAVKIYTLMEDILPAARGEIYLLKAHVNLKNRNPARALEALKLHDVGAVSGGVTPLLAATYIAMDQWHKVAEVLAKQPDSTRRRLQAFISEIPADREFIGQWALVNYYQFTKQSYWVFQAARELHAKWPKSNLATAIFTSNLATIGQLGEAAKILETLPNRNSSQNNALFTLLIRSRQTQKAKTFAEKLVRDDPGAKGVNLFLADYHFNGRDKDKAVAYYEKELALDSASLVCLNNLAWEYGIVRKDFEKAKPYLRRLQTHVEGDPRIMDTIGWILARNGDSTGIPHLRQAVNLVPDHPAFQYHLAWALSQAGSKEEARKYLKAALESKLPFEEKLDAQQLSAQL